MDRQFGPEFSLLVRCCRWNFAKAQLPSPPELPPEVDWNGVVTLVRRHRVQGLVWNALAQHADRLPSHAKEALSSEARSIAATNLAIAAECRELHRLFGQASLPIMFIKGLTVGALAYRSPLLKMGWDIDLLIDPCDLPNSAKLLLDRGYVPRIPSDQTRIESWHRDSKESVWSRDDSLHIELHTRLADNKRLIPTIDVHSPRLSVEVAPSISLPTLAEDQLIAYLAVHGASSAWFRLKWISDFAALLPGRSKEEIEQLYRRSQELGAARAMGQALLLADRLFDALKAAPELRAELARDRATRALCSAALRIMANGNEPTERPLGTFPIHWTQLLLRPGLNFKLSELKRQGYSLFSQLAH